MRKIGLALFFGLLGLAPAQSQQISTPALVGIACAYNTALPTVVTANFGLVQCDSNGRILLGASSAVLGHVIVDSGTLTAVTAITNALPAGTNIIGTVASTGSANLATAQVSVTTGNITVAAARTRQAVTVTNVTGTSAIYCGNTGVSTSTGTYLGATAGSSITLNTSASIFCTVASVTQTVSVAETY